MLGKKTVMMLLFVYVCNSLGNFCSFGQQTVCGVDYITYPNVCALQSSGVNMLHYGECSQIMTASGKLVVNCPHYYTPVCGVDLVTYGNQCRLKANKVALAYNGACNSSVYENLKNNNFINKKFKKNKVESTEVAGAAGESTEVESTEVAGAAGESTEVKHKRFRHKRKRHCDCNGETSPICSLNGVTFESQCVLNCAQEIAQNFGACPTQCGCEKRYNPVCGIDGRTYDNPCILKCTHISKFGNGECNKLAENCKNCSLVPMPVCGVDNITYLNLCTIRCKNVKLQSFGACKVVANPAETCSQCSNLYNPICGTDGKNYQNECLCICKPNCKKYSDGYCPDSNAYKCVECEGVISKVCGNDGKTYDNYCFLKCANVKQLYFGPCAKTNERDYKKKSESCEKSKGKTGSREKSRETAH